MDLKNIAISNTSKKSATEEYIEENKYVMSLARRIIKGNRRIKYKNPILKLLLIVYRLVKNFILYSMEVINNRNEFISLIKMKGIKNKHESIVIGNGPSQGYLSIELLKRFKKNGGEIFVVNFWHLNKKLSEISPDYLIISDPATLSFKTEHEDLKDENNSLLLYLKENNTIKIVCPFSRMKELEKKFEKNRIIGFSDAEFNVISNNISPIFPRGYISMTLFKALAVSLWFGYKEVYVIGMDNTYPRNIFCDIDNKVLNLEKHAGLSDIVVDQSSVYRNISEVLFDLSVLFNDIGKFASNGRVTNIDEYSLTDAFKKIKISDFEKKYE